MSDQLIRQAKLVSDRRITEGDILIRNGKIEAVGAVSELPEACEIVEAEGCYVSSGFIDIHVHGGGGYDFMDCSEEAFCQISKTHLQNGTTTMLPTAVSAPFADILKLIDTYQSCEAFCPNFYGLHLEGPYISKNQKGAHNEKLLHSPTKEEIELLLTKGKGILKRITAAPELEGVDLLAREMCAQGVVMSLGHSDADCKTALQAFSDGFSHVTHLYCATPSIRKIDQVITAGVREAAYLKDEVTVELIADGKHVAPEALQLAVKIKGMEQIALTTDALRPAGTEVKESWLGAKVPENRIVIEDGVAKLPDRSSFAGSIATASMLLEKGVKFYGMSLADTVFMLTQTPAKIMRLKEKGAVKKGYDADLVFFDQQLRIQKVFLKGKLV